MVSVQKLVVRSMSVTVNTTCPSFLTLTGVTYAMTRPSSRQSCARVADLVNRRPDRKYTAHRPGPARGGGLAAPGDRPLHRLRESLAAGRSEAARPCARPAATHRAGP